MLPNTGKLAGYTLFITGASRGIGKAIALKAAKDGANVIIAAKTAQAHPKLPGTIYDTAKEVEAAGGKALACVVDIRDEHTIQTAVDQAVSKFGGIDILINNASAISLTGTLDTPMKKVDLMLGINLRGTYLTSKIVIPHLLKSKFTPHILNMSPPLNLNPFWFKNHTAYTIAKYGMSMSALGMAEEFRGQIAVNALWPKTAIQTVALNVIGGAELGQQSRTSDIIADAAYIILSQPKDFTGNFLVDEDYLKEHGVKEFDQYAVTPGHPLLPDIFLDLPEMEGLMTEAKPAATPPSVIETMFDSIKASISEEFVQSTKGIYQFNLSGENEGVWFVDLKNGAGGVGKGEPPATADVVMTMDSSDFVSMFTGKLKAPLAFMSGKLKIKGDMALALKLDKLMGRMQKAKL